MTTAQQRSVQWLGLPVACFLLGLLLMYWLKPCPAPPNVVASVIDVQIDSVEVPVYVPKIVYKYIKARVTSVVDNASTAEATVEDSLSVQPCEDFVAEADSTNDSVRVVLQYISAEQRFAFELQWLRPLTPLVPLTTIRTKETVYEKREWWIDALTHVGAATLGLGIGSVLR